MAGPGCRDEECGGVWGSGVSEASGSHNVLIVCCEIPFQHVMKLSSFSLPPPPPPSPRLPPLAAPPRRRGSRATPRLQMEAAAPSIFHEDFSLLILSLSSSGRAVLCQRRGVGAAHLLLLQGDCHGVQLPGEGSDPMEVKPPAGHTEMLDNNKYTAPLTQWKTCFVPTCVLLKHIITLGVDRKNYIYIYMSLFLIFDVNIFPQLEQTFI